MTEAFEPRMHDIGYTTFGTPLGPCGIAWSADGVVGVQLPEDSEATTLARLRRRFPQGVSAPPTPVVRSTIDAIVNLLAGQPEDLRHISLDLRGVPPFNARVYAVTREIGPGRTSTYGRIALRLGDATLARAVGQALGRNPFPIVVPCHRVLAAGGELGGFTANGGVETKRRLLAIEGAAAASQLVLFD